MSLPFPAFDRYMGLPWRANERMHPVLDIVVVIGVEVLKKGEK
jgi:hypothetical protein